MPRVVGQDGMIYDLTGDQAEQYYGIQDFAKQQEFLRATGGGAPKNELVGRPLANALGGGAIPEVSAPPTGDFRAVAIDAANKYGVPASMFVHQIAGESGFNPAARNYVGAGHIGIAQFDPNTARSYGIDPTDPTQSLYGAAKYMADLKAKLGSWPEAMKAYLGAKTPEGLQRVLSTNPNYAAAYQLASGETPTSEPVIRPTGDNALAPQPVVTPPATGSALGVGALSGLGASPWTRLLLLSSMLQSGGMTVPLVRYNPKLGMTTIEPRPPSQLGSETGELPQTTRIPVAPGPQPASAQSRFRPVLGPPSPQTPTYVTKTGMRDYWSLPEALSLATGESGV